MLSIDLWSILSLKCLHIDLKSMASFFPPLFGLFYESKADWSIIHEDQVLANQTLYLRKARRQLSLELIHIQKH